MDPSMRDLDRLEEMDEAVPSRRIAVLIMAALSTAGLVFAMGILLRGESARGQLEEPALSPLDAIDRNLSVPGDKKEREAAPAAIDKTELTFHSSLISAQSPELLAAIEAADAELRALESPRAQDTRERDGKGAGVQAAGADAGKLPLRNLALALAESNASAAESAVQDGQDEAEDQEKDQENQAGATSSAGKSESARFAPPRSKQADDADEGEDSAPIDRGYALQVGSYKSRADAERFAKELDGKGYPVFIERATIEGRGEFHRVRLGPFKHRGEALRLRSSFESTERVYPLLVRLEPR